MMKQFLTSIICCLSLISIAQVSNVDRIEIELKDDYTNEVVHEFGENGFILSARSKAKNGPERNWKFDSYSTNLEEISSIHIPIPTEFKKAETFRSDNSLFILFRGKRDAHKILSFESGTFKYELTDFEMDGKTRIYSMKVYNNYAYFSTKLRGVYKILSVNLATGAKRFFPMEIDGYSSKKIKIEAMQILEESNEIFVYLEVFTSRKTSTTYFVRMNDQGEMKDIVDFSQIGEEIITSSTASYLSENKYVLTGTYSTKSRHKSEGMYFSIFENGKINTISFYNFLDLDNFLNYLPARKQAKIEKKKKRKKSKDKDFSLRYYLASHEIIQLADGYMFLSEAYYPTYRSESYTTTSVVNGISTTVTHTRSVFDGYQYTHAFMAKFDASGKMIWDQTFNMRPVQKPFYPKRFINIAEQNAESIKLVYASGSTVFSKLISFEGEVIEEEESTEIETGKEDDKMKWSVSNLSYWYDNYFIAFGIQRIKNVENPNEKGKKKRSVYFINKVEY